MAANQDPEFTTVLPSEGSPMQSSAPPHAMPPPKPSKGLSIPSTVLRILAFLLAIISFGIALRSTRMTKCIRSGPSSDTVPTDASGKATPTPLPRVGKYCDPEGSIGRDLLILVSSWYQSQILWLLDADGCLALCSDGVECALELDQYCRTFDEETFRSSRQRNFSRRALPAALDFFRLHPFVQPLVSQNPIQEHAAPCYSA
ncbi:uncharacterized protein K452DRAFT_114767 [Aplosporella prunicola CBS 121167]|uniref:Uncharacterized protein n=1 Tax=Aplosporella prunicola CBS 121167 TaxID=1176127 RepID=A0A6A6B0P6_9PEZI|nr:uncharacterized protein K452DRAFT_114767 [Aplosporella prunicola CBS 121167]KAF2137003.1 hypothetical protein K452DRAFT_114767 [Aplosporella prunicola CBS 121167]